MTNRRSRRRRHRKNIRKAAEPAPLNIEQSHTSQRPLEEPKSHQPKKHINLVKFVLSGFGTLLAIIGALAAWYELRPQISVTASPSLNKDASFEPLFTITNVGYLEIYDLDFECYTMTHFRADKEIKQLQTTITNDQSDEPGNNMKAEPILAPQVSIVKTCATRTMVPNSHIIDVTQTLKISYLPRFWLWRLSKFARFKSRTGAGGQIQWIPDPQSHPYSHK